MRRTELEKDALLLGFRERQQAQERISPSIWPDAALDAVLKLVLIVEVIWTAEKIGDLVVLALQLAGTGWV